MLNEQDFAAWANRLKHSEPARSVVAHVRCSDPARRVGGGRSNVAGRYPSKKMGRTIQFESHRVELPAIFELEYDDSVLEYYDQAPSIKLDYCSADGKRLGVLHTPDFFVIRTDSAGWEECKTEEELTRLSERNPNRYCRDDQVWICPPGRQYADRLGLYYRVRSSAGINWHFPAEHPVPRRLPQNYAAGVCRSSAAGHSPHCGTASVFAGRSIPRNEWRGDSR